MNYGMYVSAAGLLTGLSRMDTAANNLANTNTPAFKRDYAPLQQRDAARIEDDLPFLDSNALLERLGAGPLVGATKTDYSPAAPEPTGNPLDLAIRGEGFFVVRGPAGSDETGDNAGLRFTRDGRFTRDANGRLVMATTGLPVLDINNKPIFLGDNGAVKIDASGAITQAGRVIAQIQIARPPDSASLHKIGDGIYAASAQAMATRRPVPGTLLQGAIEQSGINPIDAMMAVNNAGGAVRANVNMIRAHDEIMDRAINQFGRIG